MPDSLYNEVAGFGRFSDNFGKTFSNFFTKQMPLKALHKMIFKFHSKILGLNNFEKTSTLMLSFSLQ